MKEVIPLVVGESAGIDYHSPHFDRPWFVKVVKKNSELCIYLLFVATSNGNGEMIANCG